VILLALAASLVASGRDARLSRWPADAARAILSAVESRQGSGAAAVLDLDAMVCNDVAELVMWQMAARLDLAFEMPDFWELIPQRYGSQALEALYSAALRAQGPLPGGLLADALYRTYLRMCREEGEKVCRAFAARLLYGLEEEDASKACRSILEEARRSPVGPKRPPAKRVMPRPAMLELTSLLQSSGIEVWVISSAVRWAAEAAASWFDVPAERVVGVRLEVEAGALSSNIEPPLPWGPGKAEAIRRFVKKRPFMAVGDSKEDLEMLEMAQDLAIVVGSDPELVSVSVERGWLIVDLDGCW